MTRYESAILERVKAKMDLGYQGILRLHKNSEIPNKKPKGGELTAEEKEEKKFARKCTES